jgi:hypothetical protein
MARRRRNRLTTPNNFEWADMVAARKTLELSAPQLGRALGFKGGDKSLAVQISRYESNARPVPGRVARLVVMFLRFGVPDDF